MIQHIKASNLLSFGPDGLDLELHDLNVLIGPNGSGKSNFLEIFELLKSLPRSEEDSNNLNAVISRGGGMEEWICKIERASAFRLQVVAGVEATFWEPTIEHSLTVSKHTLIYKEEIREIEDSGNVKFVLFLRDNDLLSFPNPSSKKLDDVNGLRLGGLSILSRRSNGDVIGSLSLTYERIRLYREWSFGRNTIFRTPQRADQRNDRLESDFSNLGMFLSRLRKDPSTKRALVAALQELYDGITDFEVITEGGAIQIFFTEGDFSFPATRLSDGTLRYLCLIALLLDPTPPPLICIEEPELGLHPDVLPQLADLLVDASKRTQLIVTTHSDVLIDALSERPESVLVCEKHEGQTQIKRLKREDIAHWLTDYRLGQLWIRGEIGGTRW
ncbi:MAG: AAA family ATPase [Saprospiraceae bacterium]